MANTNYLTAASPVGAELGQTHTTAKFAVGTRAVGNNGTEWIYVKASGAIRQYDIVSIDLAFKAASVTTTLAALGNSPGAAQVAFASADYGWVGTKGLLTIKVASSCAANAKIYVGTTGLSAGVADDASATGRVTLAGCTLVSANASNSTKNKTSQWTNAFFLDI